MSVSESKKILENIHNKEKEINRPLRFMELCGTHSQSVAQYGIKDILPPSIKLLSGPGCPVCVTDQEDIDIVVGLALSGISIATYGDAVQVPGNNGSLEEARAKGAKVYAVYDIREALEIQKKEPNLVFWGLGFETTTPAAAWAVRKGLKILSSHKLFPPAMEILLSNKNIRIDGFINPGHVSAIIGLEPYEKFKLPQVVAGFSAEDVLLAIDMLLDQIITGKPKIQNEYSRVVKPKGNKKAMQLIKDTFEIVDSKWRGLGIIKNSGLKLKEEFKIQDAEFLYKDLIKEIKSKIKPKVNARLDSARQACQCGLVLQGLIEPKGCKLFGKVCNPDLPQGACMVSVEGACNIFYRYKGNDK